MRTTMTGLPLCRHIFRRQGVSTGMVLAMSGVYSNYLMIIVNTASRIMGDVNGWELERATSSGG